MNEFVAFATDILAVQALRNSTMAATFFASTAAPLVFRLFGPHLLVVSTARVLLLLYRLDRAPDAGD